MCRFCDEPVNAKYGIPYEADSYVLAKSENGEFCILADNSGDEYRPVKITITYCPMCGERL